MEIRKSRRLENDRIAFLDKTLDPLHFATVRSSKKATNTDSGLLLNFAVMPLTVKRVVRESNQLS